MIKDIATFNKLNELKMSAPFHIMFCITSLRGGGAERVLSLLANHFAHLPNHQISIVLFTNPQEKSFYAIDPKVSLIHLGEVRNPRASLIRKFYNYTFSIWQLWRLIRSAPPDLIISFVDIMNMLMLLSTIGTKIPVIIAERTDPNKYKLNLFFTILRPLLYPFATQITGQSSAVTDYLGANLKHKIHIIGNPVLSSPYYADQNATTIEVISLGRLIPSKRMDRVIQAFAQVIKRHPEARLTIWGEGPERASLEKLINELNLSHCVRLPGVSRDVWKDLSKGQIFAFASEFEGFPNALCEAMATGLVPVITDYGSSARDIIKHGKNGLIVAQDDWKGLTEGICSLIKNKPLREKLSKNAQKISEEYSMNKVMKQWEEVIRLARSSKT